MSERWAPSADGDAELSYELRGAPCAAGVPLVFLHAGVADRRMWAGQLDAFAGAHRVLAYDRRGFGRTRVRQPAEHSSTDDLWAVMRHAGLERAVLVGCSQGGRVAVDAALERPERVAALVLVAPAVGGAPEPASCPPAVQALADACDAAEAAGDAPALNALEARVWLDGVLGAAGRVQGAVRELFLGMNGAALAAADPGRIVAPTSAWERLHELAVPALVAWGTLDFEHLQARCEHLVAGIAGARRQVFVGTAHLPNLERPEAFDAALRDFLAACGPSAGASA